MSLYRDQGVVLRTIRLGEADRIVTLATAERGKVRAVVKGVRRTSSRWGGRLEPMSHVAVVCWQGRELDTVTQAEVLDHWRPLREDLDRLRRASTMLEAVDQVSQEGHANPALYRMLVGALRAMSERDSPLLVAGFFWKLLALEGAAPVVDACARCGAGGGGGGGWVGDPAGADGDPAGTNGPTLVAFDLLEGGALCPACRRGLAVSPDALAVVRRILGGDLAGVLNDLSVPSPLTAEVDHLAAQAVEVHLERRLRSLHVLDRG